MKSNSLKKELCLLTYFEKFIQDSRKGRRLQPNGKRLSAGTITNYTYTLKLLQAFAEKKKFPLRIHPDGDGHLSSKVHRTGFELVNLPISAYRAGKSTIDRRSLWSRRMKRGYAFGVPLFHRLH